MPPIYENSNWLMKSFWGKTFSAPTAEPERNWVISWNRNSLPDLAWRPNIPWRLFWFKATTGEGRRDQNWRRPNFFSCRSNFIKFWNSSDLFYDLTKTPLPFFRFFWHHLNPLIIFSTFSMKNAGAILLAISNMSIEHAALIDSTGSLLGVGNDIGGSLRR